MLIAASRWFEQVTRAMEAENPSLSDEERLSMQLVHTVLPHGWRGAVDQVVEFIRDWSEESADIAQLYQIMNALLE
jgi:hypothetical protein